jgi:hypothetical protein
MKFGLAAVFSLTLLFHIEQASAQSKKEDSILYLTALSHTISVYNNQLGDQTPLFNGSLYPGFPYNFREGSPYFLSDKATGGSSVEYDSMLFTDVSLLYDDLRQLVVAVDQGFRLQLRNARITSFTILNHRFIQVYLDSSYKGLPGNGYYEQLYPGRAGVLKRTTKEVREVLSVAEGPIRSIYTTDSYYIHFGSEWIHIKSRRELLNVMKDHRKEIQRFIRKNDLNYKKDTDNTLVQVAGYYDQLAK